MKKAILLLAVGFTLAYCNPSQQADQSITDTTTSADNMQMTTPDTDTTTQSDTTSRPDSTIPQQ